MSNVLTSFSTAVSDHCIHVCSFLFVIYGLRSHMVVVAQWPFFLYMTPDTWHRSPDNWHMTCEIWHTGVENIVSKFQVPSSYCLLVRTAINPWSLSSIWLNVWYDKVSSLAYISFRSKVFVWQNADALTKRSLEKLAIWKLDGVGPDDNRPSID